LKNKYIASLIEKAESDDSADILGEVSEHNVDMILENLPDEKKEAIKPLIAHDEDTAGGLMQSELIALKDSLKVKEAIPEIKKKIKTTESINYVYVVDSKGKLKGVISIANIFTSNTADKLSKIMKKEVVKVYPDLDKEKVAEIFRKEDIMALPVVSKNNTLLGRITADDVLDVMEEEATEDMFRIAGIHPDENIFDPINRSIKKRLPWLVINLATTILAALTISLFENTLQKVIILAAFMPIIAGMGGNAGTQTLTLMIRGIALNQLNLSNFRKAVFKEVGLGVINGFILGLLMGIIGFFWTKNLAIGIVILLSMTINLFVAGLIGSIIPLTLKLVKIDPAIASSVIITTFTDVIGFFSFLGIATLLINFIV